MTDTVTSTTNSPGYRVAFDVMAGIEPLTFLPGTTVEQIKTRLAHKFLLADVIDDGNDFDAAIDVEAGTVVVSVDGDVIEHGSITAIEPAAPKPEPTPRQRFAAELHRIADDIVRLDLPVGTYTRLTLGVLDSRADLERLAGYLGSAIDEDGGTANNIPSTEHTIRLDDTRWGPQLLVHAQIPPEQQSEAERLRARVAELEAKLAEGGAR